MNPIKFLFLSLLVSASATLESIKVVDVPSLEGCYRIQPYKRTLKQSDQSAEQTVTELEIINHCSKQAVKLAESQKANPEALKKIANAVRAGHRAEPSLKIYSLLVNTDKSLRSCSDPDLRNAVEAGLAHPQDYPSNEDSYVQNSYAIMNVCMKDASFASEMQKFTKSDEVYLQRNVCGFFLSKKISSDCKPPRK